jgi:hypothetical protein
MIENISPNSRPQSGLGAASTVIETLAEGGITRFMAIYLEHDAAKVGPVRSTRVYFNDWAAGFHSILAHVGGNDDAQAGLFQLRDIFNIDEMKWQKSLFDTGTSLFWRSTDRVAPHNMYAGTNKLRAYAAQNGQDWTYTQANLPHKQLAPYSQRGHAASISVNFVDPLNPQVQSDYSVRYVFNRGSDTYTRFMGGAPHVDVATGKTITPTNVIIMRTGNGTPDYRAGSSDSILLPTIGSGPAWYFRDGKVLAGRWQQQNVNAPLYFHDLRGRPVAFNPGQTWIEVAPSTTGLSWQSR